jgi:tetratricopeptide (TPR) repeat protein
MRTHSGRMIASFVLLTACFAAPGWALKKGERIPGLKVQALEGRAVSSADLAGRVVAICFWATWGKGASDELQYLQSLQKEFGTKAFLVLPVNEREDKATAMAFLAGNHITLRAFTDDGVLARSFEANGLPHLLLVDGAGVLRARYVGYGPTLAASIRKDLLPLLAAPRPAKQPAPTPPVREPAREEAAPGVPPALRAYSHLTLGAAHINVGDAYLNAGYSDGGHYAEAVKELKAGLAEDPKNVDLLVWLGVAQERKGDKVEAIKQYQAALALEAGNSYAREGLRRLRGLPPTPPPPGGSGRAGTQD